MNYHICEGQVTEENSRLLFYPDAEMEVRICNGCIEIKMRQNLQIWDFNTVCS